MHPDVDWGETLRMAEQKDNELKHIALLRKIMMERRTGVASFETADGPSAIRFDRGMVLGGDAPAVLAKVMQEPVRRFDWDVNSSNQWQENVTIPILPRQAFSEALAKLTLAPDRVDLYRKMFSLLPQVMVRYLSVFRSDPAYQGLFQRLYQMTLATGGVRLGDFFATALGDEELRKQVYVVLALYCLGDLLPAAKSAEVAAATTAATTNAKAALSAANTANVVSRIMARLSGRG